ncbi:MAG: hypothetical protein ACR2MO_00540 [Acidimicrobiales bacterium]
MSQGSQPFTVPEFLDFLERLTAARIHYTLDSVRSDAVMVRIAVPGERWEVEFLREGWMEVEVFRSSGGIQDSTALDRLFEEFSD